MSECNDPANPDMQTATLAPSQRSHRRPSPAWLGCTAYSDQLAYPRDPRRSCVHQTSGPRAGLHQTIRSGACHWTSHHTSQSRRRGAVHPGGDTGWPSWVKCQQMPRSKAQSGGISLRNSGSLSLRIASGGPNSAHRRSSKRATRRAVRLRRSRWRAHHVRGRPAR